MARIKNQKRLSDDAVAKIAQYVLSRFAYETVDTKVLLSEFRKIIPLPMMFSNSVTQVWIDKEYIAYSYLDQEVVVYVYITKKHIDEEERAYKAITKKDLLHSSIKSEFSLAKRQMTRTGKDYALFKKRIVKES